MHFRTDGAICLVQLSVAEALIETDSLVPSDKEPERHWL